MSGDFVRDVDALTAYIAERERRPFAWRGHNCAAFVAGAVKAQSGFNPLAGIVVRSHLGAARVLAAHGGMQALVSSRLARIAPSLAKRGDVAGVDDEEFGLRLMIVEGATLVGPGPEGNKRMPRSAMRLAWSAAPAQVKPRLARKAR